jgi:hypothetical protein
MHARTLIRVRRGVGALAAVVALCAIPSLAEAQEVPRAGMTPPPAAASLPPAKTGVTEPATFGTEWSGAVRSALDTLKSLSTIQSFLAQRLLPAQAAPRALWKPAPTGTTSETAKPLRAGPVTFAPLPVDLTSHIVRDPRARPIQAVLLGASVPLPWMVP